MFSNTQMYMFSNVHLRIKDKKTNRLIKEINKKNTVTKFALNGIASMLKGEFNDSNYNKINNYVPKYLALGTNQVSQRDENVTVGNSVTVFDNSLLSEVKGFGDRLIRVRLEDVKRVDNTVTNEYIKIRYRTVVTSGTIPYSTSIQELGLFTDNTNLVGGLWARITTEPITIPENSILDVIWDVVLASSIGVYPSSISLADSSGNKIDGITVNLGVGVAYPVAVNLKSSIIDSTTVVVSEFKVDVTETSELVNYVSTNNFSKKVKYVDIYKSDNEKFRIRYKYDNESFVDYTGSGTSPIEYDTISTECKSDAMRLAKMCEDINGNIIDRDGETVNAYTYKEVTYKNCTWIVYWVRNDGTITSNTTISELSSSKTYSVGNFVMQGNDIFTCNIKGKYDEIVTEGDNPPWTKVVTIIMYMTNAIIINEYNGDVSKLDSSRFRIFAKASTGVESSFDIDINTNY